LRWRINPEEGGNGETERRRREAELTLDKRSGYSEQPAIDIS
jgi:hypothetical protein